MAQTVSQTTTDHETIQRWAEARGGKPTQVSATARGDEVGIIRIDFPGYSGEGRLEPISWDEWFRKFDEASLAFVYEETTADGQRSNFNKLVARETAVARERGARTSRRARKADGRRTAGRASSARKASRRGARAGGGRGAARGGKRATAGARRGKARTARRSEAARSAGRGGSRTSRRGPSRRSTSRRRK